jgi:hypothetical protein
MVTQFSAMYSDCIEDTRELMDHQTFEVDPFDKNILNIDIDIWALLKT